MIRKVTDYLDRTAALFPEKEAFTDENRAITFRELRDEAYCVATALAQKEGFFKKPVAIFMDKQVENIAAMMGVAYSGNFYTVLDVAMPVARIEKILATLSPVAIVTTAAHAEAAKAFAGGAEVLVYENLLQSPADRELVDRVKERVISTDVLFVLFTSGSTGTPKGAIISHHAVIEYAEWIPEKFPIDESTVFANQTPFYFIMSAFEIFQTLRCGCTTHVIPKMAFLFPGMLMDFLKEKQVNTIYWVPTILCMVANLGALEEPDLPELKLIMFSAEVMPTKQMNMWRRAYPNAMLVNQYGPTEMTELCGYYILDREIPDHEAIPIGKASEHMDFLILDEKGQPVRDGELGELCGRGPSLAYGYYNDPERTAEVFVQNPLNTAYEEKIYRTGDLVRLNEYGELVYMGRKDFQIKHLGHRIELGEIEAAVTSLDGIDRACCFYSTEKSKIVLFYTGGLDGKEIPGKLRALIPEYMIPGIVRRLDSMPVNLNGKIDRALLKQQLNDL